MMAPLAASRSRVRGNEMKEHGNTPPDDIDLVLGVCFGATVALLLIALAWGLPT